MFKFQRENTVGIANKLKIIGLVSYRPIGYSRLRRPSVLGWYEA